MGKAKLSVSFASAAKKPARKAASSASASAPTQSAPSTGSDDGSDSGSGEFAGMVEMEGESDDDDDDDEIMADEFSDDDDSDASMSDGEAGEQEEDDDDEDLPRLKKGKAAKKPTRPLNDAIADILSSKPRASATAPILSRTAIERKLEEEKLEEKARKILAREHKLDYSKEHVVPTAADLEYERKLRKVATRGVVKLFNAVRATQHKVKVVKAKDTSVIPSADTKEKVVSTAKSTFMDILRRGNQPKTQSVLFSREPPSEEAAESAEKPSTEKQGAASWGVLDDGFMLDAKLKDWEQEEEDEMEFE